MERIRQVFVQCQRGGRAAAIAFTVAGYPSREATIEILLAMQRGGIDIVEVGLPFSDPIGDGPVIQDAHTAAVREGVSFQDTLDIIARARDRGLQIPVVMMGYCNPVFKYGLENSTKAAQAAGVDAFMLADLPVRESAQFRLLCRNAGLSYIPVIAPNMTDATLDILCQAADSFLYVLSRMGVTGSGPNTPNEGDTAFALSTFLKRLRKHSRDIPLALGLGVSTRDQFLQMQELAQGVVVGTQIIRVINETARDQNVAKYVQSYCASLTGKSEVVTTTLDRSLTATPSSIQSRPLCIANDTLLPTHFGQYGGQYVPELLMDCLQELEKCFTTAHGDPTFWEEYRQHHPASGKPPTSLEKASDRGMRPTGAEIWCHRDDQNNLSTATHKVNSTLGQLLLARRLGKRRILAEAASEGDAILVASLCARLKLECVLYMGANDAQRFPGLTERVRELQANIVSVNQGGEGVRDAINAALQSWIADLQNSLYVPGSAIGPHPYPTIVREFQSRFGSKIRAAVLQRAGKLPDVVVVGVVGGAVALLASFLDSPHVDLVAVATLGTVKAMTPGVFHGAWTEVIQDVNGQVVKGSYPEYHGWQSYPALEPELSSWCRDGKVRVVSPPPADVGAELTSLPRAWGIPESAENITVIHVATQLASQLQRGQNVLVLIST